MPTHDGARQVASRFRHGSGSITSQALFELQKCALMLMDVVALQAAVYHQTQAVELIQLGDALELLSFALKAHMPDFFHSGNRFIEHNAKRIYSTFVSLVDLSPKQGYFMEVVTEWFQEN